MMLLLGGLWRDVVILWTHLGRYVNLLDIFGWMDFIPKGLWMNVVSSGRALERCHLLDVSRCILFFPKTCRFVLDAIACYSLDPFGPMLLFRGHLWMPFLLKSL